MSRSGGDDPMTLHVLFEAHLDVRDLDRSLAFHRDVVGLEFAYRLDKRNVALLWAGGRGRSMLGLWAGSSSPNSARLHLAFALELEAVLASPAALRLAGVEPLDLHERPSDGPPAFGWMPVASVFFQQGGRNLSLERRKRVPKPVRATPLPGVGSGGAAEPAVRLCFRRGWPTPHPNPAPAISGPR